MAYGDFTADAPTETTFLCPELTMRQLKRLPSKRRLAPETIGRVHAAVKGSECRGYPHKRLGRLGRPRVGCDDTMQEEMVRNGGLLGKGRKQGPAVAVSYASCADCIGGAGSPRRPLSSWWHGADIGGEAYTVDAETNSMLIPPGRFVMRM